MIERVKVEGFKSISSADLELGRVNCFIGANGAGKSNLLEAIGVLGAAANGVVDDESLLRRGVRPGLPRLYKSSFKTEDAPAHIGLAAMGRGGATYRISLLNPLEDPNPAWEFKTEYLAEESSEIMTRGVRSKSTETLSKTAGFAALKLVELAAAQPAAQLMRRLQSFAIYSPNTPTLRAIATDLQPRDPLGLSGGRLPEGFAEISKSILEKNDEVLHSILGLIEWVDEIGTTHSAQSLLSPSVARSQNVLKFTDRFMKAGRNTLTAYDASEGALYVLFCAVLCLSSASPKVLAIDNLDQALNPRLASRLVASLEKWLRLGNGDNRQVLFTAHNPAVLDGLDLADDSVRLFAVERNSVGQSVIRRIEPSERLLALNKDFPLSRLWIMGHLGAVPNV